MKQLSTKTDKTDRANNILSVCLLVLSLFPTAAAVSPKQVVLSFTAPKALTFFESNFPQSDFTNSLMSCYDCCDVRAKTTCR